MTNSQNLRLFLMLLWSLVAFTQSQNALGVGQEVVIRWSQESGASGYIVQVAGVNGRPPTVINTQTKAPEFRWIRPPFGEFSYRVATVPSDGVSTKQLAFSAWTKIRVVPPAPGGVKLSAALVTEPQVIVSTAPPISSETATEFQSSQSNSFSSGSAKILSQEPTAKLKLPKPGKYWVRARFCSTIQKLCTNWSPPQTVTFTPVVAPKEASDNSEEEEGEEEPEEWDPIVLTSHFDLGVWAYATSLKQSSTTAGTQVSSSHSVTSGGGSVTVWPIQPAGLRVQTTRTVSSGGLPKGSMSETSVLLTLRLAAQVMPFAFSGALGGRSRTFPLSVGDDSVDRAATIKTGVFDAAGILQVNPKVRLALGVTGDFDAPGLTSDWKSKGEQSFGLKVSYLFTPHLSATIDLGAGSYSYFTTDEEAKFYTRGETIFTGLAVGLTI